MPPKAPKPAAKKGPPAAMLAKLKMKMEMQKAEEERLRREAEEEERRRREEERLAEEQRKFEEEERLRERERKKEEERLAHKAQKALQKNDAIARMRASGFIVPDVERIREEEALAKVAQQQAPPLAKTKPRRPAKPAATTTAAAAASSSDEDSDSDAQDAADAQTEATESDAEVDEDDWEQMAERDERRAERHKRNEQVRAQRAEAAAAKEARRAQRREAKKAAAAAAAAAPHTGNGTSASQQPASNLRSPICCVLGHVDTGKTSLLDYIRSTNVQGGEAGGITQQIGATFFPYEALLAETRALNEKYHYELKVPGLLVIDTPGHESFTNLRSRGSSLCDIAVLVIDITHGLEKQTRESIRLLRERKCPFIVALNKVDRIYGWQPHAKMDIQQTLSLQSANVRSEYATLVQRARTQLAEEGLNAELYYDNKDRRKVVSIVPTSAKTGEGVCDLLLLEIQLVQLYMEGRMTYKDDLQCTVLEVKATTGYGFTMDVILINGELHEGDAVCVCGQGGPIFTQIRSLLTPQPMKELRVRGEYVHHKTIKAAMGVKIAAPELEDVVPGTPLIVVRPGDDKDDVGGRVMRDAASIADALDPNGVGVAVQSSTLGALEALLSFLRDMKVPVGHASIGTLHKRHLYHSVAMRRKEGRYAVVLAFDVVVTDEAREMAQKNDVLIFEAKIIYKLFDMFTQYLSEYEQREKDRLRSIAIFPVQLTIIGDAFNHKDPIIMPVRVDRGQLRAGTPLCAVKPATKDSANDGSGFVHIGRVLSIERENKPLDKATPGMEVSVKVAAGERVVTFGQQFNQSHTLVSHITRQSVDAVKKFKDELTPDDVNLLATYIKMFNVPK